MAARPCGTLLYLRSRSDRAAMPASRPCRVTIARVGGAAPARWSPAMPAKLPVKKGKVGRCPLSGQRQAAGPWLGCAAPAPPRQIPAAPHPRLFATRQG
jgi:hypothetical protein